MMQPKIQIRMLSTGEVRALSPRDAKLLVLAKKASYVEAPEDSMQQYETRHLEAAPARRRGRPPKSKSVD